MFYYLKKFWKDNLILTFIILAGALAQTLSGILIADVFNALVEFDWEVFFQTLLTMLLIYIVFLVFLYFEINLISKATQKMSTAIRKDITQRIEKTSYSEFHTRQTGTYTSWLSNDITTIEKDGFAPFYMILRMGIGMLASMFGLLFFHWSLSVWSVFVGLLTILLPRLIEKKISQASLYMTEESERFLGKVTSILQGFDTLFSFNLLEKVTKDTETASLKLADAKNRQKKMISIASVIGTFGNVFGQLSILALTGYLAFRAFIPVGSIAATGNLASSIFNALGNASQLIVTVRSVKPIFEKFERIVPIDDSNFQDFKQEQPSISIRDLHYAYGEKQVINKLNAEFSLGGKFAIVGESGSGKSTLLNILNGKLTDYSGSVQFFGNELKNISGKDLRSELLYIDQIPYIFEGSIRDNITLDEEYSDEQLEKVVEESALTEVLAALPKGLDTPVGEAGRDFSGGQRQRIALARGLIRGRRVVLLDEGTSSLDKESALKIEEKLLQNPNLTVIMITHHLRNSIQERLDGVLDLSL